MNKKKGIIITLIVLLLIGVGGVGYYYLTKQDKDSTLTILEKKWIEDNKNQVIDLGVANSIPGFSYEGKGAIFDFIASIEGATHLTFNKVPYEVGSEVPSDYSFAYVKELGKNDIRFYQDHYVLVTKENKTYNSIKDIDVKVIGALNNELEDVNYYLKDNKNISFKGYDSYKKLFEALNNSNNEVEAIIVPNLLSMNNIIKGKSSIAYHITEMQQNLVLKLGNDKKLNGIISKYTKKWINENLDTSYRDHFTENYFSFNDIYEQAKTKFTSKTYNYGFVSSAPYNVLINGKLVGTNNELMKRFAALSGIEIKFKEYKNYELLLNDFNENKVDFFYDVTNTTDYKLDTVKMTSVENEMAVIASHLDVVKTTNSFSSLKGEDVGVVSGTALARILKENGVEAKEYNNIETMLKEKKNDFYVIDLESYEVYSHSLLSKYRIDIVLPINENYAFVSRDVDENKVFNQYFNYYLSFVEASKVKDNITYPMFNDSVQGNLKYYLFGGAGILIVVITIVFSVHYLKKHPRVKKTSMSKESKLKYIDLLTSLKNRNYLNENMEKWDESGIYPQAIVIADLNNVAYINDNYGHEEGDNVIREAANILIRNQIENSEIMRTNGNEFLIYLMGYDEKQIVTYIRKLTKEFKDLSHGFGAALGYSIIQDPIKTVDDAINEATLDMRTNKEENNN